MMSEKFMCIGKKQDIGWIDWARFIGIYLVVFGHVLQVVPGFQYIGLRPIWDWIYLFHMPLFFVISGYLYRQTPARDFRKIFFALVIPYLIYQLLYLPVRGAWKFVHPEVDSFSFWIKLLTGCLMGDGYETPISNFCCLPCWFIICIIHIRILFSFIKITRKTTIILSILSVAFLYIRKASGIDLYCCTDSTIMALPYFLFGHWAKEKNLFEKHDFNIIGGVNIRYTNA